MENETKWYKGQKVYLIRKKNNGYPYREIGEELIVASVLANPKCVRLVIEGKKHPSDSFKLHESFVSDISEIREDLINELFIKYFSDDKRHLICYPYSIANLHEMASNLNIGKHWFHKDHYDIPKRRIEEIRKKTINISTREIVRIKNGENIKNIIDSKLYQQIYL